MSEKTNIYSRLAKFQASLKPISKEANNPFFDSKYATLATIQKTIQPLLEKQGLRYLQPIQHGYMKVIIYDLDGNTLELGEYPVNTDGTPQQVGSAVTYARRYSLCSVLGIITEDEDDDGNSASKKQVLNKFKKDEEIVWLTEEQYNKLMEMIERGENIKGVKGTIAKFSGTVIEGKTYKMKREYKNNLFAKLNTIQND